MSPRVQTPNDQFFEPIVVQQPHTVTHNKLYWLNMSVAFTDPAVANELRTVYTDPQGFSVIVYSAWSDLMNARVRYQITASKTQFSTEQVPISAQAGYSGRYLPLLPWQIPIYLRAQSLIQGSFINTGSEIDGFVCWYTEKVGTDQKIHIKRSQSYWLFVDLTSTSLIGRTTQVEDDMLIWGAACHQPTGNNPQSAITARVVDNGTNEAWSSAQIPILAMASPPGVALNVGTATANQITRYRRPYLLRAFNQLRIEFSAAASGQYIAFFCERLLR